MEGKVVGGLSELDKPSYKLASRHNQPGIAADPVDGFLELSSSPPPAASGPSKYVHLARDCPTDQANRQITDKLSSIDETHFPPSFQPLHFQPSEFAVQLVLDTREIRAKQDRDYIQEELTRRGVKPIMRSLELGDALWVARRKGVDNSGVESENDEVVLDWVVERKRLDDLVGSIKDGRFHEQKVC